MASQAQNSGCTADPTESLTPCLAHSKGTVSVKVSTLLSVKKYRPQESVSPIVSAILVSPILTTLIKSFVTSIKFDFIINLPSAFQNDSRADPIEVELSLILYAQYPYFITGFEFSQLCIAIKILEISIASFT
jgi:hypothetical protein